MGIDLTTPTIYLIGVITGMIIWQAIHRVQQARHKTSNAAQLRIMLDTDAEFFQWPAHMSPDSDLVFVFPSGSWDLSEAQRANLKHRVRNCIQQGEEQS